MEINYDIIYGILNSKFNLVKGEIKDYFFNNSQQVVATVDKNLITMFYSFPEGSREIWNHHGIVIIGFAKDININGISCDILCINGLCGDRNDFVLNGNSIINTIHNSEMLNILNGNKTSLQSLFESLTDSEKVAVFEIITDAKAKGANLEGVLLFDDGSYQKIGSCGNLSLENGLASFDICGILKLNNMVVTNKAYYSYDINIIKFKKVNYDEIYKFYSKKNDWYYNNSYKTCSSAETRAFTERRKYSTVDSDSVHISYPDELKYLLDTIYESGNRSLNSKRLQMIYVLSIILNDKRKAMSYIDSYYNFNIRKCDLNKQKEKKLQLTVENRKR